MKKFTFLLYVLLLIGSGVISGCSISDKNNRSKETITSSTKGKLFIIGGGSRSDSLKEAMISESNLAEGGYAVILPMSSSNQDTAAYYGIQQFTERGYAALAYTFGAGEEVRADKLDSLRNAGLIYIPGGVQSRFMGVINEYPEIGQALIDAYVSGALIAGTSAGAAIMSEIMITGDQKKYPEYTSTFYHLEKDNLITEEGLGLITGIIIDQHFVKRARNNRLITAVMEYPDHAGIGIDESTAIVVDGNLAKVVGESQVLVYRNKSGHAISREGKLAARNLQMDIYLPGDTFELK